MRTGDQTLVKQLNKSIVLEKIKEKCPLSRAQISDITGLNKATVSTLVSELMEEQLVYEIGTGKSSGGRRPVMLYFNKNAGYSIGVDLGVNYLLTVLTNLDGEIIKEEMITIKEQSFESVLPLLKKSIHLMIDSAPNSPYGVVGIGVGVPGVVDDKGVILFAPNLKWRNIHLRDYLMEEFNIPVIIDNEANAGAWAEKQFGIAKNISNMIYVSVGIGIGTGIIIQDSLYKGAAGFSGEMGHISIEMNGKKCGCGNKGCWEMYASENALLTQAKLLLKTEDDIDIFKLLNLAKEGKHSIINLFNEIGEYIGIGLANIVNIFNPENIIIGNRFACTESLLANPINRVIEQRSLPFHQQNLSINFSSLGHNSCALGSSSFAVFNFFADNKVDVI
ncbi:ROK family protein [Bacillus sp. S/N-304-OC-R1]|uniref:ROK family transcriptional regulator n=1 Tax=Bacillus sp. S/N-304-OC-R1 TaxID=2758034 RepID=UPI001C8D49A8|nr:ROK family protein [Bacillus sp. S/N-304-OC-R1]MBY0124550.1 ROK family protein [Bacillus sp. S/N-304-OC-R1]